jgi:hypothetical protein
MLSQEDIYQYILSDRWTEILGILYSERGAIARDTMLMHAATVFEEEFFKKVGIYPNDRNDILDNLETLYLLNHGKFYTVSSKNHRLLFIELAKRKPFEEAIPYANKYPDDDICKEIISRYGKERLKREGVKLNSPQLLPMNWIEIYNRLFELVNEQGDAATYFSGPRFIDTVREFEPYFSDYTQFIAQRNREGKSTSRKIFYYDILLGLPEDMRIRIIDRIIQIVKPFKPDKVLALEMLLGKRSSDKEDKEKTGYPESTISSSQNPIIFISYSWDNDEHKQWVLNLANRLCDDGIGVILDRYYLKPGKSLPHFVEQSISKAHRVIIVFTPNYKLKSDKREGGVGYEYSIMNAELYNNQTGNEKVIPILKAGDKETSIPAFMQQYIHIDARTDDNYENSYIRPLA